MSKLPAVPKGDDMAADEFGDLPLAPTAIAPKKPALRPPKGGCRRAPGAKRAMF